ALVFGLIMWSVIFHRKSRGVEAAKWHESLTVEVLWTVVPFIILIVLAFPATKTLIKMEDTTTDVDLTIKATGYQWMWSYDYIDYGVNFYSKLAEESNKIRQVKSGMDPYENPNYLYDVDKEVVVPVGKKVRLLTTAADVIHSWWVPELGGKKDAIPGFINEMWFTAKEEGVYRGSCAELCGKDHAFMPIVVRVVSQKEFEQWVTEQGGTLPEVESEEVVAQASH
ncbi:cytochrome c oxidase, subunit II, partial [gamma proteobacterium HTCC5015]